MAVSKQCDIILVKRLLYVGTRARNNRQMINDETDSHSPDNVESPAPLACGQGPVFR